MTASAWRVLSLCMVTVSMGFAEERSVRIIPAAENTRARFLKLLERPRVPLIASEQLGDVRDGLVETTFAFDSEAGQRVPGLMVSPAKSTGRLPVVIALHGTGGSKEALRTLLRRFAERGIIGVTIDGRFAGERAGGSPGNDAYRQAIFETWKTGQGYPFFYDTVWDNLRLIDYLQTRIDVDSKRIGAIGFSKGGIELYLAAAVDERIAAAVPCIGVQSFGWALENNAWQSRISTIQTAVDGAARESGRTSIDAAFVQQFYDRVVPGIHREFDGPAMLPLIAPRPLLVINGDQDHRTPLPGLKQCIKAALDAYAAADAKPQFEFRLQTNTGHTVTAATEQYAVNWLVKRLAK